MQLHHFTLSRAGIYGGRIWNGVERGDHQHGAKNPDGVGTRGH